MGPNSDLGPRPSQVRSTLNSGNRQTARGQSVSNCKLGRVISNFVWHRQEQRCIVSNASLAKEGHCIDLGTRHRCRHQETRFIGRAPASVARPWYIS